MEEQQARAKKQSTLLAKRGMFPEAQPGVDDAVDDPVQPQTNVPQVNFN